MPRAGTPKAAGATPRKNAGRSSERARASRPVGRPSAYRPEYAAQAKKLCLLGATDDDLARFFEVAPATVDNWKVAHPGFLGALKAGKEQADAKVAKSLYQRARGYEHDAVKILTVGNAVQQVPYVERYPPDTTAAIFWLKNRRPDVWRDRQQVEHSGEIGLAEIVAAAGAPTRISHER